MDARIRFRRNAEATVAMNPARWTFACLAGCLFLATVLLPPAPSGDDPLYTWRAQWNGHARELGLRSQIERTHASLLWQAYRNARDEETARRVFGTAASGAGAPGAGGTAVLTASEPGVSIWFDADVPQAARRRINELVAAEDSARDGWHGKAAVGLLVFTDTATALDGAHFPWGFNSGLSVATKVLAVSAATGNRCVTVVRLGHVVLAPGGTIAADRQLLDGCAFYDAFGRPGPRIAGWLEHGHSAFARALSFAPLDTITPVLRGWSDYEYFGGESSGRCAGGDAAACMAMLNKAPAAGWWNFWRDNSVPLPDASQELTRPAGGFTMTLLDAMVRDIGPDRFERVWQSPRTLDAAYFDVMGEPLSAWVRRRVVAYGGAYHIGPLPTGTSVILTMLAIVVAFVLSAQFARRPAAT